jgi:hypothetical protein
LSDDREYVALADQHAPAGRAVNGDLAGHQPSINCPNSHAAQESDLSFRQKLLVIGSIHDVTFPSALRAHASAIRAKRPPAVIEYVYYNPKDLPHTPINGPMIQVFVYAFNQKNTIDFKFSVPHANELRPPGVACGNLTLSVPDFPDNQ